MCCCMLYTNISEKNTTVREPMRFVGLDQPRSWFIPIRGRSRNFEKVGSAKWSGKWGQKRCLENGAGKRGQKRRLERGPEKGDRKGGRKRYLGSKRRFSSAFLIKCFQNCSWKGGGLGTLLAPLLYLPLLISVTPGCPGRKNMFTGRWESLSL